MREVLFFLLAASILFFIAPKTTVEHPTVIDGRQAFRDGLPANANPYAGRIHSGPAWLRGWVAERDKDKQK